MSTSSITPDVVALTVTTAHRVKSIKATVGSLALNLDDEVKYIWLKKWTTGKVLCLLTRYLGLTFLICSSAGVHGYAWDDHRYIFFEAGLYCTGLRLKIHYIQKAPNINDFFAICFRNELFAGFGPMIILIAEIIFQMCVYALYGTNKKLLVVFVLISVTLFGFNILQMSTLFCESIYSNEYDNGGCFLKRDHYRRAFIPAFDDQPFVCIDALPISGIGWAVTSFAELLLFLLVIFKAQVGKVHKNVLHGPGIFSDTNDIATDMARDSVAYFAAIFTDCLANSPIVLLLFPEYSAYLPKFGRFSEFFNFIRNAYEIIFITIMTVLAPKLILDLRSRYYGTEEVKSTQLSWNFEAPVHSTICRDSETEYTLN
ncbi:hypothetical protein ACEPAH_2579 [Sanghuangporus vaninii]